MIARAAVGPPTVSRSRLFFYVLKSTESGHTSPRSRGCADFSRSLSTCRLGSSAAVEFAVGVAVNDQVGAVAVDYFRQDLWFRNLGSAGLAFARRERRQLRRPCGAGSWFCFHRHDWKSCPDTNLGRVSN